MPYIHGYASWLLNPSFTQGVKTVAKDNLQSPGDLKAVYSAWQVANAIPEQSSGREKKPTLARLPASEALMFKVKCHSCCCLWSIPHFWHQPGGPWAETETLATTWLEKVCSERQLFFEKQQVSPFPDRNQFCSNKGKFFFLLEFKFHAQLNTLKKAFIFLRPFEGTLN